MLTRQDCRTRRTTNGVGTKGIKEHSALSRKLIDAGSGRNVCQWPTVGRNRLNGMVVGKQEQNIGALCIGICSGDVVFVFGLNRARRTQ